MIDNTFSALFSSSIIRPLLFSCAIWSAMLIGCLLYFISLKQKFHPGSLFMWEAWWKLSVQRYNLFFIPTLFFLIFSSLHLLSLVYVTAFFQNNSAKSPLFFQVQSVFCPFLPTFHPSLFVTMPP